MFKKNEAYICFSAMIRAREANLLTQERAQRMLDAASFEEAAKTLTELGYADMSAMNAEEINRTLNLRMAELLDETARLTPDSGLTDFFRIKYDYHNLKVMIKSEAQDKNADSLFSRCGRIDPLVMKGLYSEEKYGQMPGKLGPALKEAKALLARTGNPQAADFFLDRACFMEMKDIAEESGNDFLKGYAAVLTDTANLKSAVRAARMRKPSGFLQDVLIPGGTVDTERIMTVSEDNLASLYSGSILEKAAEKGALAVSGGRMTEFERECDNAVCSYLKRAKFVSFGSEPVAAYIASFENELTMVRMILTGRLAGVDCSALRERLRDTYE